MSKLSSNKCEFAPTYLKSYVGKNVKVTTIHYETRNGTVYTIDPVTQSMILMNSCDGKLCVDIIMKHIIKAVDIIDSPVVFSKEECEQLFSLPVMNCVEDKETRKIKLCDWLKQYRLPIEEKGDMLVISDVLEIHPPYGINQCICKNIVVLTRVRNIIKMMPED